MMKKWLCILLTVILIAGTFAGCGEETTESSFAASNEIFTYEKVDPQKAQIVVSRTGNVAVEGLCEAFEAKNPDVQVIYQDITGGSSKVKPVLQWLENGKAPDVLITTANFFDEETSKLYFENLSTNPVIDNYESAALQRVAVDANVYLLPGPSSINAIMYNKTLFAQYGWKVPSTFDEFVALYNQIREDTNGEVEPWNPNAKYDEEYNIATEAFVYEELFGGADNRSWYNDFIAGNATFAGHMEPYYTMIDKLINNGILKETHFSYSATSRGKEFADGKIAMINTIATDLDNEKYDFGYMPFPTTKGDVGYICDTFSCLVGIPKKERSKKTQDATNRFVEFLSSTEGQKDFIGDALKISNVKNVPLNQNGDLSALQAAVDAGHMFEKLDFYGVAGKLNFNLWQDSLDIATGAKTSAECIAVANEEPYISDKVTAPEQPEIIATVPENMTILETSFYIADTYREKADAEIALISNNEAYRGNLMCIFAGDLTTDFVSVLKPRSFENESMLEKVSMTGQQLLDAMNSPPGYNDTTANCIYAYSGLSCVVAPWNELGSKYLSVKLADGSEIDPQRMYTVAIWHGTVSDRYITEVLDTYEGTWEELMTSKMKADGTVASSTDNRISLIWN